MLLILYYVVVSSGCYMISLMLYDCQILDVVENVEIVDVIC